MLVGGGAPALGIIHFALGVDELVEAIPNRLRENGNFCDVHFRPCGGLIVLLPRLGESCWRGELARELDYWIVAEGVEGQEVYDFLAAAGCDDAQGYFISRPVGPDDLLHWLHDHKAYTPHAA